MYGSDFCACASSYAICCYCKIDGKHKVTQLARAVFSTHAGSDSNSQQKHYKKKKFSSHAWGNSIWWITDIKRRQEVRVWLLARHASVRHINT